MPLLVLWPVSLRGGDNCRGFESQRGSRAVGSTVRPAHKSSVPKVQKVIPFEREFGMHRGCSAAPAECRILGSAKICKPGKKNEYALGT